MSDTNLTETLDLDDSVFDAFESPEVEEATQEENPHLANMKWYIVQTVSGYEQKASTLLEAAIKDSDYADYFGDIIIPIEKVITRSGTKVKKSDKKIFPNYIFLRMEMNFTTLNLVRNVTHILGFLGHQKGKQPEPVPNSEIERILKLMKDSEISPKETLKLKTGDKVIINDSSFANIEGEVSTVNEELGKVTVTILFMNAKRNVELNISDVSLA
ncbi:transcription termination/antitermination protein NusG [Psittacicella hinzii]|uniref:Transcription termination/antitermination protein NusG n=1 Tax=Psittacicella hinzii TaxID=2028575 RepID=A0A3A1YE33_9GAMM|nr:transcription termination/antitermination protein NusG [Psittacicella hinzii]RIY36432.1 hypothetical protein CKF58_05925 [Psittacicella hinzii]